MITCAFCSNPAENACAWPSVKRVQIPAKGIVPGDIIFDSAGRKAEVVSVAEATFTIQPRFGALSTRKKEFSFSLLSSMVLADRLMPCGSPVCEAHLREVGEDRRYCADHWMAWEQAA